MAPSASAVHVVFTWVFFVLLCGGLLRRTSAADPLEAAFDKWIADYSRVYASDAEKSLRFEVFKTNLQFIESTNSQPGLTYKLGLNKFADLTNSEFMAKYASYIPRGGSKKSTPSKPAPSLSAPISVDWRSCVPAIKDQGNCGE